MWSSSQSVAFEIEIVGRLVEQEQIGLGRTARPRARPACASRRRIPRRRAAGRRARSRGRRGSRPRAPGAACAPMSASRVWISAMRWGSRSVSASRQQRGALGVGGEHDVDAASRGPSGASCASRPMRARGGNCDAAALGRDLAGDHAEQRGLAGAVAADQPDARAGGNARRGVVDQEPPGDAHREVVDHQHARFLAERAAGRQSPTPCDERISCRKLGVLPPPLAGEGWGRGQACTSLRVCPLPYLLPASGRGR